MMHRSYDGANSPQVRYLRQDANRYLRPDAFRFVRPDVARFIAPGTAGHLPEMDSKYRADQRRIPAGQPGGGRWVDMLISLILGQSSSAEETESDNLREPSDGYSGDSGDEEGEETADAEEAFRNAYASSPEITVVDDGAASLNSDGAADATDLLEPEADVTEARPDDVSADDEQGEPLPIVPVAQRSRSFTDAYGDPYYSPGGHHEMPQSVFKKWDLQPETRSVFNEGTTGPLPRDTFRTSPDGLPKGHFWDGPNGAHAQYNDAVKELSERFMNDRGISSNQMTPDHAWELLGEIRESSDPRIRGYNESVRLLRRLKRLRTGRGSQ